MRCAASERLFERLLDGTLAANERNRLDRHLASCERCVSVLEELRVIDALLLAPRRLEPAPNFTFKVMAEVRATAAPRNARNPWPWAIGIYLAISWAAIAAWFAFGRPDAFALLATAFDSARHAAAAVDGIARVIATGFGLGYAGIFGWMAFLLVFDFTVLAVVLIARAVIRPRVAARLARSESA
ncbi:MAG: zf-HC2 domain-containing protein [Candidatus Eremiobacteraeota bacterium]|nr:zf-HC2 domain-containing protein [Candidatus Eremiobacteraeota bacterium]